jgi:predicted histone-like DNA-binding protein
MINYSLIQRVNPQDLEAPRKFYAVKQSQGEVSVRQLARQISRETMLGLVETTAVIEALLQAVPETLAQGKVVRLGEFGSFRLTLSSEGVENPETFTTSLIGFPNLRFRGGSEFQERLKSVRYSRVNNS